MAGRPSIAGTMPFGDANGIVLEMASEVLPMVKNTPVIAGVCAQDPFRLMDNFLEELMDTGFSGVQNFPTVGVVDGNYRYRLERAGMGFDAEIRMIAQAHELGLLTTPYAFDEEQAEKMARANADVLVAHMGGTIGGTVGNVMEMTLEEAATRIQRIHDAAKSINPDILVICHGGPIAEPEDAKYILQNTKGIVGFYGASSMERLPVERAITEQVRKFREIQI